MAAENTAETSQKGCRLNQATAHITTLFTYELVSNQYMEDDAPQIRGKCYFLIIYLSMPFFEEKNRIFTV